MADTTDILAQAASATQQMNPGAGLTGQGLTSFGPTPMIQPPPIPRFQPPPVQYGKAGNEFQTVSGRKRADKEALFHSVAGLIKSGGDYIQAKKQRALTMDITRLMEAQQGLQESRQMLQQNPNDTNAKEAMQRNTAIINDIASDPKKLKQLQKAFNIDLFGDGKNKVENAALVDAWKQFGDKQKAGDKSALNPMAERLMQSQPMRQGLNPEAQAQAAAIKAGLIPGAGELLKANVEIYKSMQTAQSAEARDNILLKASQIRADAETKHAGAIVDAANVHALGQQAAAQIAAHARVIIAEKTAQTWDKRLAVMKDIAKEKTANPYFKQLTGQSKVYTDELNRLVQENKGYEAELAKKGSSFWGLYKFSAHTDAEQNLLRTKMKMNMQLMDGLKSNLDTLGRQMGMLNKLGVNVGMGGSNEDNDTPIDIPDSNVPPEN